MTKARLNRMGAVVPLVFSALAFAIVMGNVIVGVPPQPDENASAHMWQLLMAGQLPLIVLFLLTADWRSRSPVLIAALQLFGIAMAALPVWLAGY